MPIGTVISFWTVSFLLVLVPGADWAYAIAAGLRDRSVLPAVAGLLAGYVALTAVVAAGVAALLVRWPPLLAAATIVGALYLLWLGITTVARPSAPSAATGDGNESWLRRMAKGAGISGLNPKALLLFLALLPQFVIRGTAWPFAAQIANRPSPWGEQATGVTRSIPDRAPMWWMRISVVPVHIPPTRPAFARNSLMISAL